MIRADERYIGSISHGTLREDDVLQAVHGLLELLSTDLHSKELSELARQAEEYIVCLPDRDVLADFLWGDCFDALNSVAPAGCYFGAHEGDGSDIGFWYAMP